MKTFSKQVGFLKIYFASHRVCDHCFYRVVDKSFTDADSISHQPVEIEKNIYFEEG